MKTYIGTKIINAKPMTRVAAEALLGRNVGGDKYGDGYLVQYSDSYQSWIPGDVFDEAYRLMAGMTFGAAIEALKAGQRVARAGWNGKGLWLEYIPADGADLAFIRMSYPAMGVSPYPNGARAPWAASQTDALAEDWAIVE